MTTNPPHIAPSLLLFGIFYGGMVTIAGVLGAKQVAVGPLAVEAGIFPFLMLVAISSGITRLHGSETGQRLVRYGFVPLVIAILLTRFVLLLPTDPGMYEPAKDAFPVILGQSSRMMLAGIAAYGISVTLNVALFARFAKGREKLSALAAFAAAALSQIVDTFVFIGISFYGVRPIGELMAGQMFAKVVLSAVLVPLVVAVVVRIGLRLDGAANSPSNVGADG